MSTPHSAASVVPVSSPDLRVEEFADDVRRWLAETPRQIPSKYLYDALGSALFEAICELPWYRVTRAELGLLRTHGRDILAAAAPVTRVVELGSGSGIKLATLLEHRPTGAPALDLRLIDVSPTALETAARTLNQLPGLSVVGLEATYEAGLESVGGDRQSDGRTLTLFLGSNIGNFNPANAAALLTRIRGSLSAGDAFLIGTDLVKPEAQLLTAYDDPLGVTAAFNLNLCERLNRELGANFDLASVRHRAIWNASASRVEMHIEATRAQDISIPAANVTLHLDPGDRIWTESSYKYDAAGIAPMLADAAFRQSKQWIDDEAGFAITLATAI